MTATICTVMLALLQDLPLLLVAHLLGLMHKAHTESLLDYKFPCLEEGAKQPSEDPVWKAHSKCRKKPTKKSKLTLVHEKGDQTIRPKLQTEEAMESA